MEYRALGRSGVKVSVICLGTMNFGGATDEPTSTRIVAASRERGVNFIDTADQYTSGRSEEVVGRAIRSDRDRWVLATKLANPGGTGPNEVGLSRKWMLQAVEASLKRLGTDYIDIYYLHKETMRRHSLRPCAPWLTSSARARYATSGFRIIARGGSRRSARSAIGLGWIARS